MDWIRFRCSGRSAVAENELKICALCGALNHEHNDECMICGWQGCFLNDASAIHMAWQCLNDQFEQVCLQHVSISHRPSKVLLGEDRIAKPFWRRCRELWQHRWVTSLRGRAHRKREASTPTVRPINQTQ